MPDESSPTTSVGAAHVPDRAALRALLSTERFSAYEAAVGGDLNQAFELYEWNMRAAGSVMVTTGMIEVVVRNAMDRALLGWASTSRDWLDTVPLDSRGLDDIRKARERATRGGREPEVHGKVVAELTFGFWRYLPSSRYLTSLWITALHLAFPHGHDDLRRRRAEVENLMSGLAIVRNRAAHHEPIYRRDLARDHQRARQLAAWVDPVAERWIESLSDLNEVARLRPRLVP